MTAVGYLSVFFGGLWGLIGSLMAFGSNFMPMSNVATGGLPGRFLMLVGVGTAAISFLLVIAGFGILRVAPWGRSLGVAYAVLGVIVYGTALIAAGIDMFFLGALGWCICLIATFSTASWKAAFAESASTLSTSGR